MAKLRKRKWTNKRGVTHHGWSVDFTDARGRRVRRLFDSRAAADNFRIDIEGKLRNSSFRAESVLATVKDAAMSFIEYCEGRMRRRERMTPNMFDNYCGHIRNYICPDVEHHLRVKHFRKKVLFKHGIGNVRLTDLTFGKVNEFRDRIRDSGLSVTSTRKILATLKLILAHAISRDLIRENVAQGVRVIGRREEEYKRVVPPTKENMRRLIAVADKKFRTKLLFAAMTGVRASELHALRWRHVNLDKAEVTVVTRVDRYRIEDVTKTVAGTRTIPIGVDVVRELEAWKAGSKWIKPDDLVFANEWGRYESHPNMIKRSFKPLFEKLEKLHAENPELHPEPPPRFNWHALRHFAISCWIDADLPIKAIQTFAGHSSSAVTMDRYGHLFKSEDHKLAMDKIARFFSGEGPIRPTAEKEARSDQADEPRP